MKHQVVVIHGGDSFNTYEEYIGALKSWPAKKDRFLPRAKDWKDNLQNDLGNDYEVLKPIMPNKQNSKYNEWKIWLERMFPFLDDKVVLIGHSLGGMFLIKYLSENKFPKKITSLHLVAPPYNQTADIGNFKLPNDLSEIDKQSSNIYFYFSKDDPIVPISEMEQFEEDLPAANYKTFSDYGHFLIEHFPELIINIKDS
jgi:uncharacterized protein